MRQDLVNLLGILVLPAVLGAGLRILCCRTRRGWGVTVGLALLAAGMWVVAQTVFSHGSELYGVLALQASAAALAALAAGVALRVSRKR